MGMDGSQKAPSREHFNLAFFKEAGLFHVENSLNKYLPLHVDAVKNSLSSNVILLKNNIE